MCSNIGTPNNHHFPFGTNEKVVVLGVILKHFRVKRSKGCLNWSIKYHYNSRSGQGNMDNKIKT